MKYTYEATYKYKGENMSFNFVMTPSLTQQMAVVENVVDGVINDVNGYHPILFDYFLAVSLIDGLTDIKLPQSFAESSEFITESNILKILKSNIQYTDVIIRSAQEEIDFIKQRVANKSSIDGLVESLTVLVDKYGDMFDGMDVNAVTDNIAKIATMSNMSKPEIIENILKFEKKDKTDTESN